MTTDSLSDPSSLSATAPPRFTQRPEWSLPGESIWAIVLKWQVANRLSYSAVLQQFVKAPHPLIEIGVDLRAAQGFMLPDLIEHTGLPADQIRAGYCCERRADALMSMTSSVLRYCPTCLQMGLHATLFQFQCVTHCPAHRTPLQAECSSCHKPIPYRINGPLLARPFVCPHCGTPLMRDHLALTRVAQRSSWAEQLAPWESYLRKILGWYEHPAGLIEAAGNASQSFVMRRLSFFGALQQHCDRPPPLPHRAAPVHAYAPPPERVTRLEDVASLPFLRRHWPNYHTKPFTALAKRYLRRRAERRRSDTSPLFSCWQRAWECRYHADDDALSESSFPPFGVAEWMAFAAQWQPPTKALTQEEWHLRRFEEDLDWTWESFERVLDWLGPSHQHLLSPQMLPPRLCWLAMESPNSPDTIST